MTTALNYSPNKKIVEQVAERTPVGDAPATMGQILEVSENVDKINKISKPFPDNWPWPDVVLELKNIQTGTDDGGSSGGVSSVSVSVGTTATLPAGEDATVVNSGTSSNIILDFGIPKGDKGDKGDPGEHAIAALNPRGSYNSGASPTYTTSDYITYNGNTYVCKVDNSGNVAPTTGMDDDPYWQIIAMQGAKGDPGSPGSSSTITVGKVTTLTEGQPATVVNVGSASAAILDFGIPTGSPGLGAVYFHEGTVDTLESVPADVRNKGLIFCIPSGV